MNGLVDDWMERAVACICKSPLETDQSGDLHKGDLPAKRSKVAKMPGFMVIS
jgi:hypothetical protein